MGDFDTLNFQVRVENTTLVNLSFYDPDAAEYFFDDYTLHLGDWSSYVSTNDILDVYVSLTLTGDEPAAGFSAELLLGNSTLGSGPAPVPLPAGAWLLLSGLTGLGLFGQRRRKV